MRDLRSPITDQTHTAYSGSSLNHWTAKKFLGYVNVQAICLLLKTFKYSTNQTQHACKCLLASGHCFAALNSRTGTLLSFLLCSIQSCYPADMTWRSRSFLHELTHPLSPSTPLSPGWQIPVSSHFTDQKTEASKLYLVCPRPHSPYTTTVRTPPSGGWICLHPSPLHRAITSASPPDNWGLLNLLSQSALGLLNSPF